MKLKYEDKLRAFHPCPSKTCDIESEIIAFRFSHNPPNSEGNFLPIAEMDVSRISGKDRAYCCSAYGLSMYQTVGQLKEKLRQLEIFNPMIRNTLGSHWVGLKLDSASGAMTPPRRDGHFNLHEASNFKGQDAIDSIGDLT